VNTRLSRAYLALARLSCLKKFRKCGPRSLKWAQHNCHVQSMLHVRYCGYWGDIICALVGAYFPPLCSAFVDRLKCLLCQRHVLVLLKCILGISWWVLWLCVVGATTQSSYIHPLITFMIRQVTGWLFYSCLNPSPVVNLSRGFVPFLPNIYLFSSFPPWSLFQTDLIV